MEKTKNILKTRQEYDEYINILKNKISQYDLENNFSEIVFLCVGTNKIVGDMIGPIVGENLKNKIKHDKKKIYIYGNMQETLNLKNAKDVIKKIEYQYINPFIITVDTALSKKNNNKKIYVGQGSIEIGKAVSEGIRYYSHVNIKGIVGIYQDTVEENLNTLKNVKLKEIDYLASMISNGITEAINYI